MTESAYNFSLLLPPQKWISLLHALSDLPEASTIWFATHHPYYKRKPGITKFAYNLFLLRLPLKLLLPGISSDCVVKVIVTYHPHYKKKSRMTEFAHDFFFFQSSTNLLLLPNALFNCIIKFATHQPHFKDKLVGNLIRTFVCAANCLCFLCD